MLLISLFGSELQGHGVGMLYTDRKVLRHDWVSLVPGLEITYDSTIHSTTVKPPF